MIKYCLWKWEAGKEALRKALRTAKGLDTCGYKKLVELVVEHILNATPNKDDNKNYDPNYDMPWDKESITVIDNGDYQGTLLFLIPRQIYQPACDDYLMSYVYYGSCSVCDTLQAVQGLADSDTGLLTSKQVDDYMIICEHIVNNMTKPYNYGWRHDDWYDVRED